MLEIVPGEAFYRTFNDAQISDIADHLEQHREIPRQYNYFGDGARGWDQFVAAAIDGATNGLARISVELLPAATRYALAARAPGQRVDIVDIGPGNAQPVRGMLRELLDAGALGRYVALDISPDMLAVAQRNVALWFDGQVPFEGHLVDISHAEPARTWASAGLDGDRATVQLVLLLDGLMVNVRYPAEVLRAVREHLTDRGLLVCTNGLDTPRSRERFALGGSLEPGGRLELSPSHRAVFELLGLSSDFYDVEYGFDDCLQMRYIRARLNRPLSLVFRYRARRRAVVLDRGEPILLWRAWATTRPMIIDRLKAAGLCPVHVQASNDESGLLTISTTLGQASDL